MLVFPLAALAGEEENGEKKKESEGSLEEVLSTLDDADYPDLVAADEEGGIIDEFAFLQEDEIVYTAAKHKQEIGESPSAVTVITREQIENTACTDVICILRLLPEVGVRRLMPAFGAVGARALVGETGDKMLVLVDGMEVNEEIFGFPHWYGLPVHFEDIDRIEIIRGPGSALYGANAYSGIVTITTRDPRESRVRAFAGAGEHGTLSLHMRWDQPLSEKWRLHISAGSETSGDWRLRGVEDQELYRVRLRVTREDDSSRSILQAGLVPAGGIVFTKIGNVDSPDPALLGHVLLSHQTDLWKAQVYLRTIDTDLKFDVPLYYNDIELGKLPGMLDVFSSTVDAEFQINYSFWEGNLMIAGANYRFNYWTSSKNDPTELFQHRAGAFVQDEQRLFDSLVLTGGARFDWNNMTPFAVSPRVAAVWRFLADQHLRVAFGSAFKKPALLYTSIHLIGVEGAVEGIEDFFKRSIGNNDLNNENMTSFDVGYIGRFLDRKLTTEADVFFNLYRNKIAFHIDIQSGDFGLPDLNNSELMFSNEGMEINTVGGSVSLTYHVRETLRVNLNYTYRYSWYVSEPQEQSAAAGEEKGDRVPWEPTHLFNASFYYLPRSGPRFGMSVNANSAVDVGWNEGGSPFGDQVTMHSPAVFFVNCFAAWRQQSSPLGGQQSSTRWWEIGVRFYNVLNDGFRDTPAVIQPDGSELGGQLIGRKIFLFFRASI